jgi:photosystem II stability/assembly factor-like uncharacterized protein
MCQLVVARTRGGGRTFERFPDGLPPAPAYDLVYRHGLAVDDSGTRLAMGSTTGALWTSDDGGESWQLVSAHLPPVHCVRMRQRCRVDGCSSDDMKTERTG